MNTPPRKEKEERKEETHTKKKSVCVCVCVRFFLLSTTIGEKEKALREQEKKKDLRDRTHNNALLAFNGQWYTA